MSRPLSTTVLERRRATQTRRFPHVCDIWRAAVTGTNEYGETEYSAPAMLDSVPCLLWNPASGRGEQFTPERDTVTADWRMHLAAGTDVLVSDTIRNIRNQADETIVGTLEVKNVTEHPSVMLLQLERIN